MAYLRPEYGVGEYGFIDVGLVTVGTGGGSVRFIAASIDVFVV